MIINLNTFIMGFVLYNFFFIVFIVSFFRNERIVPKSSRSRCNLIRLVIFTISIKICFIRLIKCIERFQIIFFHTYCSRRIGNLFSFIFYLSLDVIPLFLQIFSYNEPLIQKRNGFLTNISFHSVSIFLFLCYFLLLFCSCNLPLWNIYVHYISSI